MLPRGGTQVDAYVILILTLSHLVVDLLTLLTSLSLFPELSELLLRKWSSQGHQYFAILTFVHPLLSRRIHAPILAVRGMPMC